MIVLQEFSLAKGDLSVDLRDIKKLYERVIWKDESCVFKNNSLQNLSLLVVESKTEMRGHSSSSEVKWKYISNNNLTLYESKNKRKKSY